MLPFLLYLIGASHSKYTLMHLLWELTGGVLVLQGGLVVAYTSSNFTQAEVNYATTDLLEQELLALVRAFAALRCYL